MTSTIQTEDAVEVLRALGVRPVINASGTTTMYGGTRMRPEIMDAMNKAAGVMVNLQELNEAAGKVIADITGAEAGLVTSGASGGLVIQAAACIAGSDEATMSQLPDSTGLKNEIIIHNSHRFPYDQCYRAAGAKLVGIGCRWSTIMSVVNRSGKMSVHERIDIDPERTGKAPSAQRYPGRDISG